MKIKAAITALVLVASTGLAASASALEKPEHMAGEISKDLQQKINSDFSRQIENHMAAEVEIEELKVVSVDSKAMPASFH